MRWNLALLMILAMLALARQVAAWEEGIFTFLYFFFFSNLLCFLC